MGQSQGRAQQRVKTVLEAQVDINTLHLMAWPSKVAQEVIPWGTRLKTMFSATWQWVIISLIRQYSSYSRHRKAQTIKDTISEAALVVPTSMVGKRRRPTPLTRYTNLNSNNSSLCSISRIEWQQTKAQTTLHLSNKAFSRRYQNGLPSNRVIIVGLIPLISTVSILTSLEIWLRLMQLRGSTHQLVRTTMIRSWTYMDSTSQKPIKDSNLACKIINIAMRSHHCQVHSRTCL